MTLNTLQRAAGAVSRRGLPAAALLALAVLGGCAAFEPKTPEQAVAERATQYWQARIQGDMGKAYSLLTPAYRAVRTEKQFIGAVGVGTGLKTAEVTKVTCEAEKCVAVLKLGAVPMIPGIKLGMLETYLDDTWLLDHGQWWRHENP